MKVKIAPLDSKFMLISILGFLVSVMYIMPQISTSWGFTFMIFFLMMFIASMFTMTKSDTSPDAIDSLAIKKIKKK
ncbi:MAG: hypothetical protein ACMXX9_00515 [Candidatus Woesearchaeota archaeon]